MTDASDLEHGLILLYHAVFDVVPEGMNVALSNNTPTELMRHLTWLKASFDIVDVDSWLSFADRRGKVAITFDDGYHSALNETVPMLEALNIEAAFFLNGSMLDGNVFWRDKIRFLIEAGLEEQFIRWVPRHCAEAEHLRADQLFETSKGSRVNSLRMIDLLDRFLSDLGAEVANHCASRSELPDNSHLVFGNHSYHHPLLASLSAEEARDDIRRNRDALRRLSLSHARLTNVFALPFGTPYSYTDETLDILADEGYSQALLADSAYHALPPFSARRLQLVPRLATPSTLAELQMALAPH